MPDLLSVAALAVVQASIPLLAHLCRLARCTKVVSYLRYCGRASRVTCTASARHSSTRTISPTTSTVVAVKGVDRNHQ
jgi:hypothetical protein